MIIFIALAAASVIVNICVGAPVWSPIAVWGLFMVWSLTISPDKIEYNRISQFVKLIIESCIMLVLVERLLAPGWIVEVLSIVCFGGLTLICILLYTDFERQRHNMLPIILLAVITLIVSVVFFFMQWPSVKWQTIVSLSLAAAVLIECIVIMSSNFKNEFRKMFHTK